MSICLKIVVIEGALEHLELLCVDLIIKAFRLLLFEDPTRLNAVLVAQTKLKQQSKVLKDIISAIVNDVFSLIFWLNISWPFILLHFFLNLSIRLLFALFLMSLTVLLADLNLLNLLLLLYLHHLVFFFLKFHRKHEILINDFLSSRSLVPILTLHLFSDFKVAHLVHCDLVVRISYRSMILRSRLGLVSHVWCYHQRGIAVRRWHAVLWFDHFVVVWLRRKRWYFLLLFWLFVEDDLML